MVFNYKSITFAVGVCFLLVVSGCDSDSNGGGEPLVVNSITDIAADPTTGRDVTTGQPISLNQYALVSLRSGTVVVTYDNADRSDSSSTSWDVGFQGTNIIFNGGASGPGSGGAVILEQTFESVLEAPSDDQFRVDGVSACTTSDGQPAAPFAVCTGSDNGWYTYNPAVNLITPLAGRTVVVRTADGRFAKMRILSYYQGNPPITEVTPTSVGRYYTIEYVFQEDGSRSLEVAE